MFYVLTFVVLVGAITILLSLRDGEAGNLMFDGGSICMHIFSFVEANILTFIQSFSVPQFPCISTLSCQVRAPKTSSQLKLTPAEFSHL